MDTRVLLVLVMLCSFWCCNARDLTGNCVSGESEIVTCGYIEYLVSKNLAAETI